MPLFKCSASKAKPKNGIAYITDENKAKIVSVRNLFEDEDYAKQLKKRQVDLVKGTSLTSVNIIIVNYRAHAKITFRLKKLTLTPKNLRQNSFKTTSA